MVSDFLGWLGDELGVSRNTLIAYRGDLRVFARFLGDLPIDDASPDQVAAFIEQQRKLGRAYATQVRRMSSLRKYFAWLLMKGVRTDDPTGGVPSPRPT